MTAVFEEYLAATGPFAELAAELAVRPIPARPVPGPDEEPVVAPSKPALFDVMVAGADHEFTVWLLAMLHNREVERAAKPPVVRVTVTATEENKLVPGEYEIRTGPHPVVSYGVTGPRPSFTPRPLATGPDTTMDIPVYRPGLVEPRDLRGSAGAARPVYREPRPAPRRRRLVPFLGRFRKAAPGAPH